MSAVASCEQQSVHLSALRYFMLQLACDDGNAPSLIGDGLLGIKDIRIDALSLTSICHFAYRSWADRCSLSEAVRYT